MHGLDETWSENGNPQVKRHYVMGDEDGVFTEWHDDGSVYMKGSYRKGERVGLHTTNFGYGSDRVLRECFLEGESVFLGFCMSHGDTKDKVAEVVGIPVFTDKHTQGETWHYCVGSTYFSRQTYYLIKFEEEVFAGITEEKIEQFMADCNERYSEPRT